jgi:hypothetical protein
MAHSTLHDPAGPIRKRITVVPGLGADGTELFVPLGSFYYAFIAIITDFVRTIRRIRRIHKCHSGLFITEIIVIITLSVG